MKTKILDRYPLGSEKRPWRQDRFILNVAHPGNMSSNVVRAVVREGKKLSDVADREETIRLMRRAMINAKDIGFNLVTLLWADPYQAEAALDMCDALGIDLLYQNLVNIGGMANVIMPDREEGAFEREAQKVNKYRHVLGYSIWDEPTGDEDLRRAREEMDLFENLSPGKLMYTVAIPSYPNPQKPCWQNGTYKDFVYKFAEKLEPSILAFDYYPFWFPMDAENRLASSNLWCDLGLFAKVAGEKGLPFWYWYQGEDFPKNGNFSFERLRFSAYSGILYGAKALECYRERVTVSDGECNQGLYFDEHKELNFEIANLGNTLMALRFKRVIHTPSVFKNPYVSDYASTVSESEFLTGELMEGVAVSEHTDDYGNDYMFVFNRNYDEAQTVILELKEEKRVYEVSKKSGYQELRYDLTKKIEISLRAGELAVLRLQNPTEEPYLIEYALRK